MNDMKNTVFMIRSIMTLNRRPIEWHEERLKNRKDYLKRKNDELERLMKECEDLSNNCHKLESQINFAKNKNIESFDDEEARMKNFGG